MESTHSTKPSVYVDLMFAAYASFLIAFAVVCKPPFTWTLQTRYFYMWTPHAVGLSRVNFLLTYAALFLIPAAVLFISIRLVEHFPVTLKGIRVVTGFLAVAGFPLACLYALPRAFALIELGLSAVLWIAWILRTSPVSDRLNIALLAFHHAFWLLFAVSLLGRATRPIALWGGWDYLVFVYPTIGFLYTLIWGRGFKRAAQMS